MKTQIAYEFRKITGIKYIRVIFVVLLLLNGVFCLYHVSEANSGKLPVSMIKNVFYEYTLSPDSIEKEYISLLEWESEQNDIWIEQMRQGNYDYEPEKLTNQYAPEGFTDTQVLSEVFDRIDYIEEYQSNIQNVMDHAYANLSEFDALGIQENSYIVNYQRKVIECYENAKNHVKIGLEYTRGWDDYFSYDVVNIFIFFMVITVATAAFTEEKTSGFLQLLRCSKNGRTQTAIAKISVVLILTFIIVFSFIIESWILILFTVGYSNPINAIQSFDMFLYCPYIITVGAYFWISFAVKMMTFFMIVSILLLVSVFAYHYVTTFSVGLCLLGAGIVINVINISADNPLHIFNFLDAAAGTPLFERYRAYNIFDKTVGSVEFTAIMFIILTMAMLLFTILKYNFGSNGVNIKILDRVYSKVRDFFCKFSLLYRRNTKQAYSLSLFVAEFYKTLISSPMWMIVVLLLATKCCINVNLYHPNESYSDRIYKEYMTILSGEMTDEKRQYLMEERNRIDTVLAKKDDMQLLYAKDEIPFDEYRSYLSEYNYAYSRNECFLIVENHAAYIDNLEKEEKQAWFLYDTGWKRLFSADTDWTLYFVLVLLFTSVFSKEFHGRSSSGNFAQIMRVTKNGRNKSLIHKYLSSCAICIVVSAVWYMVDVLSVYHSYEMPLLTAPIQSIEVMSAFMLNMTIGQFIVVFFAVKILADVIFTLLLCSLSALLRKPIPVILISAITAFLPALLSWFGLKAFSVIDFTSLARATPLLLQNQTALLYIALCFTVCAILATCVKKKWNQT